MKDHGLNVLLKIMDRVFEDIIRRAALNQDEEIIDVVRTAQAKIYDYFLQKGDQ